MNRVAIDFMLLGLRIQIYWYSLFILLGALTAFVYIFFEVKRKYMNSEKYSEMIINALISGIIGARLYYVLFHLGYYSQNPLEILEIWNGGLAIHGGILFGFISIYLYTKKHSLKLLKTLDVIAPGLIIAQAIGRWGNFFNQEAFGPVISEKALSLLPKFLQDGMYINGHYRTPMFLIESIWNLFGFIIMFFLRKKPRIKEGYLSSFYLIWYSYGRFFIESFRTDSLMIGDFKVAQIVSIILILVAIIIILYQRKSGKLEKLYNSGETLVKEIN